MKLRNISADFDLCCSVHLSVTSTYSIMLCCHFRLQGGIFARRNKLTVFSSPFGWCESVWRARTIALMMFSTGDWLSDASSDMSRRPVAVFENNKLILTVLDDMVGVISMFSSLFSPSESYKRSRQRTVTVQKEILCSIFFSLPCLAHKVRLVSARAELCACQ